MYHAMNIYRTWEIFGEENFWQTMQVKANGDEKFGEQATVSAYAIYVVHVSVNIGEEDFGEWLMICQTRQFFPYQNFMYGIVLCCLTVTIELCGFSTCIASYMASLRGWHAHALYYNYM